MPDKPKFDPEAAAPLIADHMAKAADPDYWHACFAAALDETGDLQQSLDLADEAAKGAIDDGK